MNEQIINEQAKDEFGQFKDDVQFILRYAGELITADRLKSYGAPDESFKRIAKLWGNLKGIEVQPREVALMMIMLKASRLMNNLDHTDSWADIIGYAAIGSTLGE